MTNYMTFNHTIKGLFGTVTIEETTDIDKKKIAKCFEVMKNQPSAYLWINFEEYSIGYWFDRFSDAEKGIIRKTTTYPLGSSNYVDIPITKAKRKINGILRESLIY